LGGGPELNIAPADDANGTRICSASTRKRSTLVEQRPELEVVGSRDAFEDLYRKEFPAVLALAYALSGSRWIAEDLAQDAFLAAHREWARIERYDEPGAWVRRVVANMSVSVFRRRTIEARALARFALRQAPVVAELPVQDERYWRAVRALPRRQAQVIALYYLEDRPASEIADILGMAPATVRKHLHDGRRGLARTLGGEDEA
jgi:RNA polymerase sigma factor (sigma-70 family)